MGKNFFKIEASEHPDNLFANQKFNVLLNLDDGVRLEQQKHENREWYDVICGEKKKYSISVGEAERITKEVDL